MHNWLGLTFYCTGLDSGKQCVCLCCMTQRFYSVLLFVLYDSTVLQCIIVRIVWLNGFTVYYCSYCMTLQFYSVLLFVLYDSTVLQRTVLLDLVFFCNLTWLNTNPIGLLRTWSDVFSPLKIQFAFKGECQKNFKLRGVSDILKSVMTLQRDSKDSGWGF